MDGNAGSGQRLHIMAAMLAYTGLLENPFGAVWAFSFITELGGKAISVTGAELIVVGIDLLAHGAGFHGRVCSSPVRRILAQVLPQRDICADFN